MQKVTVRLASKPKQDYLIYIGNGIVGQIKSLYNFSRYSKVFIITDRKAGRLMLDKLTKALPIATASVVLPAGEKYKDIASVQKIWTAMHQAGCDRQTLVINLGGGVIGDIGGFAASTYMRGVDFLNIPTTLLSQVDASVGGKTGFNFSGIKNLVGTFNQPIGVVIDTEALAGLSKREFLSGFAEIIKHGLIWDKAYFEQATAKKPRDFSPDELVSLITQSCHIKAEVIQDDETEKGFRKLLNYGHTIGHALEALSLETPKPLLHGEAVGIGMRAEAIISHRLGLLSKADLERIEQVLVRAGLPTNMPGAKLTEVLQKMQSDKKNNRGKVNFILLSGLGKAVYGQEVTKPLVAEAIRAVTKNTA